LKIVQKSLGVMRGVLVHPKAVFRFLAEMGTMRVGEKEPGGRVPPCGQERERSLITSSGIAKGVAVELPIRARVKMRDFILNIRLGSGVLEKRKGEVEGKRALAKQHAPIYKLRTPLKFFSKKSKLLEHADQVKFVPAGRLENSLTDFILNHILGNRPILRDDQPTNRGEPAACSSPWTHLDLISDEAKFIGWNMRGGLWGSPVPARGHSTGSLRLVQSSILCTREAASTSELISHVCFAEGPHFFGLGVGSVCVW